MRYKNITGFPLRPKGRGFQLRVGGGDADEEVRRAKKVLEEKLLEDIEDALSRIEETKADGISKNSIAPMLRVWIKSEFGYVPDFIKKDQLERYANILRARINNNILSENLTRLTEASDRKEAFSSSDKACQTCLILSDALSDIERGDSSEGSRSLRGELTNNICKKTLTRLTSALEENKDYSTSNIGCSTCKSMLDLVLGLEKGDLQKLLRNLKDEFSLPRPVIAVGLLALYAKQAERGDKFYTFDELSDYITKLLYILTGSYASSSPDAIKYTLFGSGKIARRFQSELFEMSDEIPNAFRLKPSVFKYIEAKLLDIRGVGGLGTDSYFFESAYDFIVTFKEHGFYKYRDVIVSIMEGEREDNVLVIDWMDLYSFNPVLAKELLENPDKIIEVFENAVQKFEETLIKEAEEFAIGEVKPYYDFVPVEIHFKNLPQVVRPRDIREEHFNKFVAVRGIVSSISVNKPFLKVAVFKCKKCGHGIRVLQSPYAPLNKPTECPDCGNRSFIIDFSLSEKTTIQHITIQDSPEDLERGQVKKIRGYVIGSNVGQLEVGEKVTLYGIVRIWEKLSPSKIAETEFILEVNHVEKEDKTVEFTPEDIEQIKALKRKYGDYLPEAVAHSIAPWVVGYERVKKALAMAVVGADGLWKRKGKRSTIHVLLVGDPSTAKTDIAFDLLDLAPKAMLAQGGSSTSAVGLTVTVQRDEFTKEWTVYGGTLVLANGGIVVIDEYGNLNKEVIEDLKTAMESGIIPVNKATISGIVLKAETSIIATANPKYGHVNRQKPILQQLDLPSPIVTRFDLIFLFLDYADEKRDRAIIRSILKQAKEEPRREIPSELLRKLFAYAKTRVFPKLTPEAEEAVEEIFVKKRKETSSKDGRPPLPIRFGDALMRLAYAHAKLRLSDKVEKIDVLEAWSVIEQMVQTVAIDEEGQIDPRILEAGVSTKTVDVIDKVLFVIRKYEDFSEFGAPIGEVIEELEKAWGIRRDEAFSVIERLLIDGRIYEPKTGFLKSEG